MMQWKPVIDPNRKRTHAPRTPEGLFCFLPGTCRPRIHSAAHGKVRVRSGSHELSHSVSTRMDRAGRGGGE